MYLVVVVLVLCVRGSAHGRSCVGTVRSGSLTTRAGCLFHVSLPVNCLPALLDDLSLLLLSFL